MRAVLGSAVLLAAAAFGTIPLETSPTWTSNDDDYATGGAAWDLDGDGWLDVVMGNGNDMALNRDAVYYNREGELETTASWRSADLGYDGHIDLGDIDDDGDMDVVVTGFLEPHREQLYRNDGGRLTASPVWENEELDDSFSCALGDVDGDGDLDLATVSGYFDPGPVLVFKNDGGMLEKTAYWRTPDAYDANDVGWADVDDDGDLDLAIAGHDDRCYLFDNANGVLDPTPEWASDDVGEYNQLTFGDVNGDGWRDMVVSDNSHGLVELYLNEGGRLATSYAWSAPLSRASCVKLADADADGDLDLAVGGWWSPVEVFENDGGGFGATPAWQFYPAGGPLVGEQAIWTDLDNDGLRFATEKIDGDGVRKLFYLAHTPLHYFGSVRVDGQIIGPDEYSFHAEDGWLALAQTPRRGSGNVVVNYCYSTDLELGVTNWDRLGGSCFFRNTRGANVWLAAFTVRPGAAGLTVEWRLGGGDVDGFNLYRREGAAGRGSIVRLNDRLLTGGPAFDYEDNNVVGGRAYDYWLEAVGEEGRTFGPARGVAPRPASFYLSQNYPNPAATTTTIVFTLARPGDTRLDVFDLAGRKVAPLMAANLAAGSYEVHVNVGAWPPGVYIYRLRLADGDGAAKRMVVAP